MPTIYAAGDTAVHADMGLIGEIYTPGIAILPIGDHYTMGPLQAAYAARLIAAPEIVPGHYGTFGLLTGTPEALRERARAHRRQRDGARGEPRRGRASLRVTFSIVACDAGAGQLGVAVASKFLAVGAVVPWLEAGVGAIATQALANTRYGPDGLALLRGGASAREALDAVLAADAGRDDRQAGFVDARGRAATHTGERCMAWAGGRTGPRLRRAGQHPHGPRCRRRDGGGLRGEHRRARRAAAARAGGRRCRRRRPPRAAVRRHRRGRARRRLRRQRRQPRRPARRRPRRSGDRAAAPLRHPRPAHGHDAGGGEAPAQRRARRRGARPARPGGLSERSRRRRACERHCARSSAPRTSRPAGGTRSGSIPWCSSTCAPAPG